MPASYKDGAEPKNGDKVTDTITGDSGVLYDVQTDKPPFTGRIAKLSHDDPEIDLGKCLRIDTRMPSPPPVSLTDNERKALHDEEAGLVEKKGGQALTGEPLPGTHVPGTPAPSVTPGTGGLPEKPGNAPSSTGPGVHNVPTPAPAPSSPTIAGTSPSGQPVPSATPAKPV